WKSGHAIVSIHVAEARLTLPGHDKRPGVRCSYLSDVWRRSERLRGELGIAHDLEAKDIVLGAQRRPVVPEDVRSQPPGNLHATSRENFPIAVVDRWNLLGDARHQLALRVERGQ